MMIRYFGTILLLISSLNASDWQERLHILWNQEPANLSLQKVPGAMLGPVSFLEKNDTLLLLDAASQSIIQFHNQEFIGRQLINMEGLEDFILYDKSFLVLAKQRLWEMSGNYKRQIHVEIPSLAVIKGLKLQEDQLIFTLSNGQRILTPKGKWPDFNLQNAEIIVRKSSPMNATVFRNNKSLFSLTGEEFGAIQPVKLNGNQLWLYVEIILKHKPLTVDRQLRCYSLSGKLQKAVELPRYQAHEIFREYQVSDDNLITLLFSNRKGLYILLLNAMDSDQVSFIPFPEQYHQTKPGEKSGLEEEFYHKTEYDKFPKESVSRQEALDIADTYYQHSWTASAANITNGQITDPDGNALETPEWVVVGANYDFPYKWGGFNTINSYDAGLLDGKSAGDKATSAVSQYAVGVDCSGYV
ncbi:MAG TPA: hypothetical protein ENN84_06185, partial [Candidatus Marinimicrobia bacterium]|nr:hypothetical protein [Candidatus Neomarinimicrobiota bacterium]